jgi:polysaccharide export outer membrane protein
MEMRVDAPPTIKRLVFVQDGDLVLVSEADRVYVVGNVLTPQALAVRTRMTLTQALASAGGTLKDSRTEKVRLIRLAPDSSMKTQLIIDLKAIAKHKVADPVLEANDIIDVPRKHDHTSPICILRIGTGELPIRVIN